MGFRQNLKNVIGGCAGIAMDTAGLISIANQSRSQDGWPAHHIVLSKVPQKEVVMNVQDPLKFNF
jgi:hypothetical protein